ncbi:hypothetical protein Syun_025008 [Stephania yunnanensis]|uniref:Uncharacterized protein n=1 Tax=Stephania yunnanensis TaxID=152371 RepID=A0AAP0HQU9_9MAGN
MQAKQAMGTSVSSSSSSELLDIFGLFGEASSLLFRNGRRIFFSTIFIVIPSIYLLSIIHDFAAAPLIEELEELNTEDEYARIRKDVAAIIGLELAFFFVFSIIFLFEIAVTVHHAIETYMKRPTSLKELILRSRTTWRRLVITWSSIVFITIIYIILLQALILPLLLVSTFDAMVKWICLLGLFAVVFYLYFAVIWTLSIVVSIAEDCLGFKALERARHLISGRKVYVFALMFFLLLVSVPVSLLVLLHLSEDDQPAIFRYAVGTVVAAFFCVAQLFVFVVFTVFYYECRKFHGELRVQSGEEGHSLLLMHQISNV